MENENNTAISQPVQEAPKKLGRKLSPWLIGTVCAAILVLCMFLPLFVVTKDYEDYFASYPKDYVDKSMGINIHELESVSPIDYGRIYGKIYDGLESAVFIGLTAALGAATLFTLLFAAINKPIGALIFDIVTFVLFRIMASDLIDRGVVPSNHWKWGFGYYLFYIALVGMAVITVWMLIVKIRARKSAKISI